MSSGNLAATLFDLNLATLPVLSKPNIKTPIQGVKSWGYPQEREDDTNILLIFLLIQK